MAVRAFVESKIKDRQRRDALRTYFLLNAAIVNGDTVADLDLDDFSSPSMFVIRCWGDFDGATLIFTEKGTSIPIKDIADNAVAPADIGVFSLQHVPLDGIAVTVAGGGVNTSINVRIDQYI